MINEIRELIDLDKSSVSGSQIEQHISAFSPMRRKFIQLLQEKNDADDAYMVDQLYGGKRTSKYYLLKKRVYDNLIDVIFFSDHVEMPSHFSGIEIKIKIIRRLAAIKILGIKGAYINLEYLCRNLIKEAQKVFMNDVLLEVYQILMMYFGQVNLKYNEFTHFKLKYDSLLIIKLEEDVLQYQSIQFFAEYAKHTSSPDKISIRFKANKLKAIVADRKSFKLTFYALKILCLQHEIRNNYSALEQICIWSIDELDQWAGISVRLKYYFYRRLFVSQLKLGKSKEMISTSIQFEKILSNNSQEYFVMMFYKVVMYFHTKEYNEGCKAASALLTSKYLKVRTPQLKETLSVVFGYCSLLVSLGYSENQHFQTKYRISKLMNEVPFYQREKRGTHISILSLHILFLLKNRKYDALEDRVDALKQYSYRYLRQDDTFRSNCFIKMIIEIPKANFHPVRTETYTKDLYKKLKAFPIQLSEQPIEVEIIPYEDLWEMIKQLLEENSKIRRGRPRKQMT